MDFIMIYLDSFRNIVDLVKIWYIPVHWNTLHLNLGFKVSLEVNGGLDLDCHVWFVALEPIISPTMKNLWLCAINGVAQLHRWMMCTMKNRGIGGVRRITQRCSERSTTTMDEWISAWLFWHYSRLHFYVDLYAPEVKWHDWSLLRPVFLSLKEIELLGVGNVCNVECQLDNNSLPTLDLCNTDVCCIPPLQDFPLYFTNTQSYRDDEGLQRKTKKQKHEKTWKEKSRFIHILFPCS